MFAVKTMLSFFFCKTATTHLGTSERTKQYRFSSEKECSPAAAFKKNHGQGSCLSDEEDSKCKGENRK